MHLFLVFVTTNSDGSKSVASYKVNEGKVPLTSNDKTRIANQLLGDGHPPVIWLTADYKDEIPEKLREAGFDSEIEFIQNYSKVI